MLLNGGVVQANDECADAIDITSFPFSTTGDVTKATSDFVNPTDTLGNLTCGISPRAIGVWYRIESTTSNFLQATITKAPEWPTKFNAALFEGSSCTDKICRQAPGDYQMENQRTQPTLTWFAQPGVSYYLHVAGIDEVEVGPFDLDVEVCSIVETRQELRLY
jgi:hypothetical protein